jgi:hypothetical protein
MHRCFVRPPASLPESNAPGLPACPPAIPKVARIWLLILGVVLVTFVLGGCTLLRRPAAEPWATYRPAFSPHFTANPAQLAAMPQYSMTVEVDPATPAYTGTVDATVPITAPLNELYFRLYPNLSQFKGQLQVSAVSVNGINVNYGFAADGSAVHLVLPKPLPAGQPAYVRLSFNGNPLVRPDGSYALVGKSQDTLSMGTFYPILAPQRPDGSWALDIADAQGDPGFQDAGLYQVTVTAPADQVIVATGTQVAEYATDGGRMTRRYVQGPAREFTMLLSPRYQMMEEDAYGTRVRSYYLPEDAEAGKSALYDAVAALEIYSDQFGPYPYRDMAVVEAPLTFRGQEFPGLSLIGSQTYNKVQENLEKLVAHEVAHQWWYNQVGSDQTQSPWQDEGLAEFSMYLYYLARYGNEQADLLRLRRWEGPVALARQNGIDAPIGRPVAAYKQNNYEQIVYAKGALFFANLRDEMGADTFREALRVYLDQYRWAIATPGDLRAVLEQVTDQDLGAMFAKWVQG